MIVYLSIRLRMRWLTRWRKKRARLHRDHAPVWPQDYATDVTWHTADPPEAPGG